MAAGIRLTLEEFIKRSIEKHGELYIYDKVIYKNQCLDVLIKCIVCDKYFPQSPKSHMSGKGCPGHKKIRNAIKKKFSIYNK